eukprot:gene361-7141_t
MDDPHVPRVMMVRNPYSRLLSAYLAEVRGAEWGAPGEYVTVGGRTGVCPTAEQCAGYTAVLPEGWGTELRVVEVTRRADLRRDIDTGHWWVHPHAAHQERPATAQRRQLGRWLGRWSRGHGNFSRFARELAAMPLDDVAALLRAAEGWCDPSRSSAAAAPTVAAAAMGVGGAALIARASLPASAAGHAGRRELLSPTEAPPAGAGAKAAAPSVGNSTPRAAAPGDDAEAGAGAVFSAAANAAAMLSAAFAASPAPAAAAYPASLYLRPFGRLTGGSA